MWFEEQSVACLAAALEQFENYRHAFDSRRLRQHALRFRPERFDKELFEFIAQVMGVQQRLAA
jgi:hypothetical protein